MPTDSGSLSVTNKGTASPEAVKTADQGDEKGIDEVPGEEKSGEDDRSSRPSEEKGSTDEDGTLSDERSFSEEVEEHRNVVQEEEAVSPDSDKDRTSPIALASQQQSSDDKTENATPQVSCEVLL